MWTLVALLLIGWMIGLLSSNTFGGWVHLLPILAVLFVIAGLFGKRKRRYSKY